MSKNKNYMSVELSIIEGDGFNIVNNGKSIIITSTTLSPPNVKVSAAGKRSIKVGEHVRFSIKGLGWKGEKMIKEKLAPSRNLPFKKGTLRCPECGEDLHFKQVSGLRIREEIDTP